MTDRNQLKDRARDELFSHINRCGVLQAAHGDQEQWLDETMEYLGERFPDLGEADLHELHTLGLRFCRPAIPHGKEAGEEEAGEQEGGEQEGGEQAADEGKTVSAGAENTSG